MCCASSSAATRSGSARSSSQSTTPRRCGSTTWSRSTGWSCRGSTRACRGRASTRRVKSSTSCRKRTPEVRAETRNQRGICLDRTSRICLACARRPAPREPFPAASPPWCRPVCPRARGGASHRHAPALRLSSVGERRHISVSGGHVSSPVWALFDLCGAVVCTHCPGEETAITVFSLLFARRKNTKTKSLLGVKPRPCFPSRSATRADEHYVGRSRSLSYPPQIHLFDRFALRIIPPLCLTRRASSRAQRAARAAQPRACLAGHARRPCPAS